MTKMTDQNTQDTNLEDLDSKKIFKDTLYDAGTTFVMFGVVYVIEVMIRPNLDANILALDIILTLGNFTAITVAATRSLKSVQRFLNVLGVRQPYKRQEENDIIKQARIPSETANSDSHATQQTHTATTISKTPQTPSASLAISDDAPNDQEIAQYQYDEDSGAAKPISKSQLDNRNQL